TVEENIERCAEAVVQVNTPVGLGSGFVIHPDGFVVTNHHVIAGEQRIVVTLFRSTDREMRRISFEKIRIVAIDPHADLALLKIERPDDTPLHIVPLGNSRSLAQGEAVFSIGSPLGFDRTVSEGIVSLRNREMEGRLFIQSTVQINPGNSGGPLFNLRGEVIGVTNMKIRSVGIEGLNFAIPAEGIKYFLDNADAYTFDQRNPNAGFRYFMISNTDKLNLEKGGSP
ncbi:MAG: trypsin-like serine protease, partial [Gammaproteobacteria bacterium]|nr:trypsin-like serine protease [Gammaproteobacteria bacterium]